MTCLSLDMNDVVRHSAVRAALAQIWPFVTLYEAHITPPCAVCRRFVIAEVVQACVFFYEHFFYTTNHFWNMVIMNAWQVLIRSFRLYHLNFAFLYIFINRSADLPAVDIGVIVTLNTRMVFPLYASVLCRDTLGLVVIRCHVEHQVITDQIVEMCTMGRWEGISTRIRSLLFWSSCLR